MSKRPRPMKTKRLQNYLFSTKDESYNTKVQVDNSGYITLAFDHQNNDKSFSLEFDYNNSEQLMIMLSQAQKHMVYQALNELYGSNHNDIEMQTNEKVALDSEDFDHPDPDYKW